MKTFSYEETQEIYFSRFFAGRHGGKKTKRLIFPYGKRYACENFVSAEIELDFIDRARVKNPEVLGRYQAIQKDQNMDEVWLSIGRKMKNGSICPNYERCFRIYDGNHRITAARAIGREVILAMLPESHYKFYLDNKTYLVKMDRSELEIG